MKEADIRKYAALMTEFDLSSIEITEDGATVRLERDIKTAQPSVPVQLSAPAADRSGRAPSSAVLLPFSCESHVKVSCQPPSPMPDPPCPIPRRYASPITRISTRLDAACIRGELFPVMTVPSLSSIAAPQ